MREDTNSRRMNALCALVADSIVVLGISGFLFVALRIGGLLG